jgi:hypothetical protein
MPPPPPPTTLQMFVVSMTDSSARVLRCVPYPYPYPYSCCRLGVTVAGVYRQLYRHCSEPIEHMAPADRAAWARETVHIYGDTRDGARTRVVWDAPLEATRITYMMAKVSLRSEHPSE